jgi:hypothetical protein
VIGDQCGRKAEIVDVLLEYEERDWSHAVHSEETELTWVGEMFELSSG